MMLLRKDLVLTDDVGLGKTLEMIVHFTYLKTADPDLKALVLTEKSAMKQWQREFAWIAPNVTTQIITAETHPNQAERRAEITNCKADVLITSYSTVLNYADQIVAGRIPRYVLYADEPVHFKNFHSKTHKQIAKIAHNAVIRIGATACLIENDLVEAMAIFHAIHPGKIMPMATFEQRFLIKEVINHHNFNPYKRRFKIFRTVGYKDLDLWRELMKPYYYGRRQDDPEVQQQLPEVITKDIEIELGEEQSKQVVDATNKIVQLESGGTRKLDILQSLTLVQQLVNGIEPGGTDRNHSAPLSSTSPYLSPKLSCLLVLLNCNVRGREVAAFSQYLAWSERPKFS